MASPCVLLAVGSKTLGPFTRQGTKTLEREGAPQLTEQAGRQVCTFPTMSGLSECPGP